MEIGGESASVAVQIPGRSGDQRGISQADPSGDLTLSSNSRVCTVVFLKCPIEKTLHIYGISM